MNPNPNAWILLAGWLIWSNLAFSIQSENGRNGMVVAGHPQAAAMGRVVLQAGGNAMDAAVTTALALGVAEPYGSGLGGKGAILYYDAQNEEVVFVDGMDAAGSAFNPKQLGDMSSSERAEGGHSVAVPGLLAALSLAHKEWGKKDWESLVTPVADFAESGFEVVDGMPVFFARRLERIRSHPETARLYLVNGDTPPAGSILKNPDQAKTLRLIAAKGAQGFYDGPVAQAIVAEIRKQGSLLTEEDFRNYKARKMDPISIRTGNYRLFAGAPPTTGGSTALLGMKLLEHHPWNLDDGFRSAKNVDAWARALRHLYPRIQRTMADHPNSHEEFQSMSESDYLLQLRAEMGNLDPSPAGAAGNADTGSSWTTHFVIADAEGNIACVTQSLSHHFGSGVTAPGTGVVLNNSLKNFSFSDPQGVNYGAGHKRPRSTVAPVIVFEDNQPVLAFGLPGGGRIPTTTFAFLIETLYFGESVESAMEAPRLHLLRDWSRDPVSRKIQVEAGVDPHLQKELRQLGWIVEVVEDTEFFGGITAIEFESDGSMTGWADDRRTNSASGF